MPREVSAIYAACLAALILFCATPALAQENAFWIEDYVEDPANRAGFSISLFNEAGEEILPVDGCVLLAPDAHVRMVMSFYTEEDAGLNPGVYRLQIPQNLVPEIERDEWFDAEAGGELPFSWRITQENVFEMRFFPGCENYYEIDASVGIIARAERSDSPNELFGGVSVFVDPEVESPLSFELEKSGEYEIESGEIRWTVQALIPAHISGKCERYSVSDLLYCGSYYAPSWDEVEVSLTVGEETFSLKEAGAAGEDDLYAYEITSEDLNGMKTKSITLLTRCACRNEICADQKRCLIGERPAFCACHSLKKNARLTISYKEAPADEKAFERSGITNHVNCLSVSAEARVDPPDLISKRYLGSEANVARYQVSLNKDRIPFGDETLTIEDEITGAKIIPESVQVFSEEGESRSELTPGEDFSLTFSEGFFGFEILIPDPGDRAFEIEYEAIARRTGEVSNTASLRAYSWKRADTDMRRLVYDSSVKSAKVKIRKRASGSLKPVAGARYGLFSPDGRMIASAVTDEGGEALFSYNWTAGILFVRERVYFIREVESPPGFALDGKDHYFCLSDPPEGYEGELADLVLESVPVMELYDDEIFILPETGGGGRRGITLFSLGVLSFLLHALKSRKA